MSHGLQPVRFGTRVVTVAAVAFDKDGTLLQSQPFWHELYRLRRALVREVANEEIAGIWEREAGASGGQFDRRGPFSVATLGEEITLTAGLFYRQFGWSWERCRDAARWVYEESNRRLDLAKVTVARSGAVEVVRSLKQAGVAVGVLTSDNADRARRALALVGLPDTVWDFLLTPEDVDQPKPAPDMVLAACAAVGCPPEMVAVVGDSAVDMQMGRSAGAFAAGVPEEPADASFLAPLADVILPGFQGIVVSRE